MKTVGVICEYNPFHNGHAAQLRRIRAEQGPDCAAVCLMSGNYVQRGEPALFHKAVRARAAILGGADLVLELPLTVALSSAEGFADGGVRILTALGCEGLSFGSESGDGNILMSIAKANLDPAFDSLVRAELDTGCSYPTARQRALERLWAGEGQSHPPERLWAGEGQSHPPERLWAGEVQSLPLEGKVPPQGADEVASRVSTLFRPNDILAVEYCKAILRQGSPLRPLPILRPGSYHAATLDPAAPSATALRKMLCWDEHCSSGIRNEYDLSETNLIRGGGRADKQCLSLQTLSEVSVSAPDWTAAVPEPVRALYAAAPIHTMEAGERAVLAILRTLPDEAYAALPFGAEGLWSKLMKAARSCASVEEVLTRTKSKRYTLSRIRRMLLCAVLGLTEADLSRTPPYVRVLAFNDRGRAALREMKARLNAPAAPDNVDPANPAAAPPLVLINAGETPPDPSYCALETRTADLYALFSRGPAAPGGDESRQRVIYEKQ